LEYYFPPHHHILDHITSGIQSKTVFHLPNPNANFCSCYFLEVQVSSECGKRGTNKEGENRRGYVVLRIIRSPIRTQAVRGGREGERGCGQCD
jgi:hypothetical protein